MPTTKTLLSNLEAYRATIGGGPPEAPGPVSASVPTLLTGVSRPLTPMLRARFEYCGAWHLASHGDWLGLDEMNELMVAAPSTRLGEIWQSQLALASVWANDAGALFRSERLSYFAGSARNYERVYLVWFDEVEEPELWAYDTNGEARYVNLDAYLTAHVSGDLSAYDRRWLLAELDRR